ncbi:dihydroorotase [Thermofilum pendens]|uniref:Dihydroorotase n=1 Tax=Thermofilum pendens (strain DSM 2475 / Hrk 5) TaxID=368408 RepID=A1RZC7_THEPD|nr:dihydroorotase family protein [Thermofilum pendens]ABL78557.1 dihydroorotase, multifunctional complex type [Thermofilum pendens Hrk 5]
MGRAFDLVVTGKAYIGGRVVEASIGVEDGRIAAVSSPALAGSAEERIELGKGYLVLPGMVDIHVHMREPGQEYKEDWRTGSRAAVKGGVTFVADMPNNKPPANTCERLAEKLRRAGEKSLVDFAFYAGFSENPEELLRCPELFVGGKLYPEELFSRSAAYFARLMAKLGKPLVVHAEDPSMFRESRGLPHSYARPPEAELSGVRRALRLCGEAGAWVHVTHVSTGAAVTELLSAKLSGLKATFDVTPHHALLTDSLYSTTLSRIAKVNPPLRGEADRSAVYSALARGLPDALVTDHAPHSPEEKASEDPPPGFPGLELALHLLLSEVLAGRLPLGVIDLYSSRPASLLGVEKGAIAVGMDADLVVVKREEWVVRGDEMVSKARYTPFEGWRLSTKTHAVFVRGRMVYAEGEFFEDARGSLRAPRGAPERWW